MKYIVIVKNIFWSEQCEGYVFEDKKEAEACFKYYDRTKHVAIYEARELKSNDEVFK